MIPTYTDQPRQPDFDKSAYQERNTVERPTNQLARYRRITTRYEERDTNKLTKVTLAITTL